MCHVPGNSSHFRLEFRTTIASDESNTFRPLFMTLKTIAPPKIIQPRSFHWHDAKIEYASTDDKGLVIPWVRATSKGSERVFRADGLTVTAAPPGTVYEMTCIDCHNRVGHHYRSADEVVNGMFGRGELDYTLPFLKRESARLLAERYDSVESAKASISTGLREFYEQAHGDIAAQRSTAIDQQADALFSAYVGNFFPEMNADWRSYPDHSGHWYSPGCFRCHDGRHVAEDGSRISNDCTLCHDFYQEDERDGMRILIEGKYKHPWDLEKADHST